MAKKKKQKKQKTVEIKRDDARAFLVELNVADADKMDDDSLEAALNAVDDLPDKMKTKGTEATAKLLFSVPAGGARIADKIKTVAFEREPLIVMFKDIKFKTAPDWDDAKLEKMLNELKNLSPKDCHTKETKKTAKAVASVPPGARRVAGKEERKAVATAKDKKEQEAFDKLRKESTEKQKAKVGAKSSKKSETGESEMATKKTKKKATKKAAKKTAKKTTAAANGNGANKDKFGTRLGTKGAAFNAVLAKKPRPMAELLEAAGLKETMYNHVNSLIEKKLVVKTDDGYALAG